MTENLRSSVNLIRKQNYQLKEWKNGKGKSLEVAIFPSGASFPEEPFLWRLSSAQVLENGPFSEFQGYDRYLALLSGDGLTLNFGANRRRIVLKKGDVLQFSGDLPTSAELGVGTATDLNLIFKRDQVKVSFEPIDLSSKPRSFQLEGRQAFIFAVSGQIRATFYPGEIKSVIQEFETLQISLSRANHRNDEMILLEPERPGSEIALIELDWI